MNESDQREFINKGNSNTTKIGLETEYDLIDVLRQLKSVKSVWKDSSNSKFDIYFTLNHENITRGLQAKTLGKVKNKNNAYDMAGLDKYSNGMLIVGLNKSAGIGLAYLFSDEYKTTGATVHVTPNPRGKFSKLVMQWIDFILNLENLLPYAIHVTHKIFEDSLSLCSKLEYESQIRLIKFCDKYNISYKLMKNDSSPTDILLDGLKVQMKYCSKPNNIEKGRYEYPIHLGKKNGTIPYKKDENDLYIIEIASYHGDFLFLTEDILIKHGYISTDTQPGKCSLGVYPYDHVENLLATLTNPRTRKQIKGNWTCDKSLWLSTKNGSIKSRSNRIKIIS